MSNRLTIGTTVLTDADLYGGVSYEISVNDGSDYTIGTTASAKIEFTTTAVSTSFLGLPLTYHKNSSDSLTFSQVGIFTITDIKKSTGGKYNITAYDNVSKFDKIVDDYINNSTYPMTLKSFFRGLCTYCGVSYSNATFVNENMIIKKNFDGNNTTGRQVLGYIAQAAGAFAKADNSGSITLSGYATTSSISIDNTKYVSAFIADYTPPVISKLWIGMENEDVGIVSGTGDVLMRITYNPLFFGDTAQEHQADTDNVYAKIHSVSYRPVQINLLEDFGIEAGDRITINGYETIVMKKRMDSTGVVLESEGNATREIAINNDSEIVALRGKYNKLSRTLEETQSQVGILDGTMTTITQRADSIESVVQGNAHYYEQTTEPQNPVTGDIWKNGNVYKRYVSGNLPPWVTIDADEAENLLVINSIHHTLDGVVYEGPNGQTIINGSNVTTGTISSDRIHMENGAISWGNLDSDVQGRIGASSYDDDDVASLLQRAYGIEYTTLGESHIESPEIYGGKIVGTEIYAGANQNDGVLKLSSDGLNYANTSKTNIIGLGYVTIRNNQYPIISLGQGVDDSGTNQGLIKKYGNGIWIGDNDSINNLTPGGDGLFVNFSEGKIYKYENGYPSELGAATFG